jgi:hypothetical protein
LHHCLGLRQELNREPLAGLGFALSCWGIAIVLMRRQTAGAAWAGAGIGLSVLVISSAIIVAPL